MNVMDFDPATKANVEKWLNGDYGPEAKAEVERLLEENPQKVVDAFYTSLTFGTGGLRGIMGVGTNRMNRHTVRAATQGLAQYVNKQPGTHAVCIGYDSRHHSREFAEETAKVLAGNGIHVYIFSDLRPTPLISFCCRFKKCTAAIMITASHNPPEYNGYKVYWDDGGQVLPPHDQAIIAEANGITDPSMVKAVEDVMHPLIEWLDDEVETAYLSQVNQLQHYSDENTQHGSSLKVIYTSLHGTGISLVPKTLTDWGFTNLHYVDEQIIPDGRFPTVTRPNPEEREALELGIQKLEQLSGDILIATDPDADRVGIAVSHQGKTVLLNGNQVACLCLHHICEALTSQNRMPKHATFVKTIGTTELFRAITETHHARCVDVLTGFKYIAEKIREWEQQPNGPEYVFGGEESYGYLQGTYARDKDAVASAALICEMTLHAKQQGKTLIDVLHEIYQKYGVHFEKLLALDFGDGKEATEKMTQGMSRLRQSLPQAIHGIKVTTIEDYQNSIKHCINTGKTEAIDLPKSNVLLFWLEDGSKVMVRPSGTEPKVKLYCGIVKKNFSSVSHALEACESHADVLLASLEASFG